MCSQSGLDLLALSVSFSLSMWEKQHFNKFDFRN